MSTEINTDRLYDIAQSEQAWPSDRRMIYCSVTGIPWGVVSEDYVQFFMKYFWRQYPEVAKLYMARMQLFAGPSPMWQTKTPEMLVMNQHADPRGFLVYLLNWSLKLEHAALAAKKTDIDAYILWRWSMIELREKLDRIDPAFLSKVNDTILLMTGDGLYPQPHVFPARELVPYSEKETLTKLMQICKTYYDRYKGRFVQLPGGKSAHQRRHEIHNRTFLRAYNADTLRVKEQADMIDLIVADLFAEIDARATPAEHEAAYKRTGIKSATFALLKEIANETQYAKPASIVRVLQPGEVLHLKFGARKEAAQ